MPKSVSQRISDAFKDDSAADAKEYMAALSDNWKDLTASLAKQTILLFLLIAVFELLAYQHAARAITVGPLTLANTSILQLFLPTIISYFIYDQVRLSCRWLDIDIAYHAIYEKLWPNQNANSLPELVTPTLPGLWRIGTSVSAEVEQPSERLTFRVNVLVSILAGSVLPLAFEAQAFYVLFVKFGFRNILLWISISISAALIVSAVTIFCTLARKVKEHTRPERLTKWFHLLGVVQRGLTPERQQAAWS
jgi:hypothetical protein